MKTCKARIETLNSDVVSDVGLHSHDDNVNNLCSSLVQMDTYLVQKGPKF